MKELKSRGRQPANAVSESGKPETLGARIRHARQTLGLSQKQIFERVDLSPSSQQKYESDRSEPGSDALVKYATVGLNVNYMLLGQGDPLVRGEPQRAAHADAMRVMLLDDDEAKARQDERLKRIAAVISGVNDALRELGLALPEEKKTELVATLVDLYLEAGSPPQKGTILRLVKSAA